MIILIILLVITGFGVYLFRQKYEGWAIVIFCIFGGYLLIHIVGWSTASYDYNKMVAKRNAFIATLTYTRKYGKEIELAAITKNVSEWNQELAEMKYDNSVWLLDSYTDDRIDSLKFIQ